MASCDDMGQCECKTTTYGERPQLNNTVVGTGGSAGCISKKELAEDRLNPVQEALRSLEKSTFVLEDMISLLRDRLDEILLPDYPRTQGDCEKEPAAPAKSRMHEIVEERERHVRNLTDQIRHVIDRLDI
jgi:hypothetical protein